MPTKLLSLRSLALAFTAAALLGTAASAHAQNGTPRDPYVITSAPYVINKAGYYILGNNLNYSGTSGNIILIQASNVTLDFNGFYIAGAAGNTGQSTVGVRATNQSNLTIINGTIAFCNKGIYLNGTGGSNTNAVNPVIDHMRVTYCYDNGIDLEFYFGGRISNCQISSIGYSGAGSANGIYCFVGDTDVINNKISSVTAANSSGTGIYLYSGFARQNTINVCDVGINQGKYQDNLTLSCTTPFINGTDAGGNN